jgi:hypothetical protein
MTLLWRVFGTNATVPVLATLASSAVAADGQLPDRYG